MPSSWIYISLCFFLFTQSLHTVSSSSSSSTSYDDHCSSIIPQSSPTIRTHKEPIPSLTTSYIIGGDSLLVPQNNAGNHRLEYVGKNLNLEFLPKHYETISYGIFKVEALLHIQSVYRRPLGSYNREKKDPESITFWMEGFWSEISRTLCMLGSAFFEVEKGKNINLNTVLKLKYANENNPTIYTSVVSGTLESTDSENDQSYFDPFFIFSFPDFSNYNYSLVSKELFGSDLDVPKSRSLSLQSFCSLIAERPIFLGLEYETDSKEPPFLSLDSIQCSEGERKVRYLAKFQDSSLPDSRFRVDSTLIVEASWDDQSNQLFGAACRILNPADRFGHALEDCTLRLILRFPSVWTIRNDAEISGKFWSTKSYFRKINISASKQIGVLAFEGLRYEYTEIDRVKELCTMKKKKNKGYKYPNANSHAMRFDLTIKDSKGGECGWGYAKPISVENAIFEVISVSQRGMFRPKNALMNISYKIMINRFHQSNTNCSLRALNLDGKVEITAEGMYDAETGYLCMVGCRKVEPYYVMSTSNVSIDCEILVKFEFSPLHGKRGGFIKGTIESTRAKMDPLFFDDLSFSSSALCPCKKEPKHALFHFSPNGSDTFYGAHDSTGIEL